MTHPTITLKHPTLGYEARIDEEISPLILLLWDAEINTSFCCQGDMSEQSQAFDAENANCAYIAFPNQKDFLQFLTKISIYNDTNHIELHSDVVENYHSTLFDRIYRSPLNKWEFFVQPKWTHGKPVINPSVHFPSHDINEMILALKANKNYKANLFSVDEEPVITEIDQCTLIY